MFGTDQLTRELAGLITIPRVERRGFRIAPYAAFDQDVAPAPAAPLLIGRVVQSMRDTSVPYQIARDALARHALVAGLTGSGKSNTCKMLVQQLVAQQTPVLIIEPAKAEYRSLQFQTYTLGNEAARPLRLNPFKLPLLYDSAGRVMFAPVQAHIDYLKAVFNSSFVLFAPMPYILERCLHEIYIDRGWDLATGQNRRALHLDRIFPTLTDVYDKIDAVVGTLGYDQRLDMDIRAGLLARIESLRIGGHGLLLDSAHSTPTIAELLARPTVLELEALGNDEEKAFVMGLILALLYQYRVLQATVQRAQGGITNENPTLRHVVVIEEAHRLLSQRPATGGSGDHADVSGQTLSVFANMLAEVRAYISFIHSADPDGPAPSEVHLSITEIATGQSWHLVDLVKEQHQATDATWEWLTPGRQLVYSTYADTTTHMYAIDIQTKQQHRLTDSTRPFASISHIAVC